MMVVRRRLFWKIYLTLLASLLAAAVITAGAWTVVGRGSRLHWGVFHVHLGEREKAARGGSGPDISLYGPDGSLVAARGPPIPLTGEDGRHPFRLRVDLPDGRVLVARMRAGGGEPGFGMAAALLLAIAGGVALAALPLTARLTRRLEVLRASMAEWGDGDTATRVDERGNDEVAMVGRSFNAAAARVDALLAAQKALLANASHELRSPLARLRLAIDLWPGDLATPQKGRQVEIVRSLAELDQLVGEILLHSRLDHAGAHRSGTLPGKLEHVDLLGLCAEEAAPFEAHVSGEPVEVAGDATLLRRLLRNLLDNAHKHGAAPVDIAVSRESGVATIVVADAGPGIAPAERERVFEPFYRPAGSSEAAGGWGLGLSLVRQIAERHGGRVTCEAAPDGSRFVVALPLNQALSPERRRHPNASRDAGTIAPIEHH